MEELKHIVGNDPVLKEEGKQPMVMLVSPNGVLHYANLVTRETMWIHETKKVAYQAYQATNVTEYADIRGDGGEYLYYYQKGASKKFILGETSDEVREWTKFYSQQDPLIDTDVDYYYLDLSSGQNCMVPGPNTLHVKRTDWDIRVLGSWSLRYTNLDVMYPNSSKCLVVYARTTPEFLEICEEYGLVKVRGEGIVGRTFNASQRIRMDNKVKFVESVDKILNLHGYMEDYEGYKVFIKKVPRIARFLKIKEIYPKFHHFQYVVKQLLVENDKNYEYIAFEHFDGTLAGHIGPRLGNLGLVDETKTPTILRNVVVALMELHQDKRLHCNIHPENVLLRIGVGGDYLVKLCGMSKTVAFKDTISLLRSTWYAYERESLGKLFLHILTAGAYKFEGSDYAPGADYNYNPCNFENFKNKHQEELKLAGDLAADFVKKLMDSRREITLLMMYHHIFFWTIYDKVSFLKDVSDEIFAQTLRDIEGDAREVFDEEWTVDEAWLAEMIKVPQEIREMKKELQEMKSAKDNDGTEGRKETKEIKETKCDKEQQVYHKDKLRDLLRLFRNAVNHPGITYPNKVLLGMYFFSQFPTLLRVAYNHVLKHGKGTQVYKQYCPWSEEADD